MRKYIPHVRLYRRFNFGDWLRDTNHPDCTLQDQGVLLRAHNAYWADECRGLPADAKQLARRLGINASQAKSMLAHVRGFHYEEDKLHFESVRINYESALKKSEAQAIRRAGGKSSGGDRGCPDTDDGGDRGCPEAEFWGDRGYPEDADEGATGDASRGDHTINQYSAVTTLAGGGGGGDAGGGLRAAAGGDR